MRHFLIGTDFFEQKRESALTTIRSQLEKSLPERKSYYVQMMTPNVTSLKELLDLLEKFKRHTLLSVPLSSIQQQLTCCLPQEKFKITTNNFHEVLPQITLRLTQEINAYQQNCIGGIKSLADESVEKIIDSPYLTATDRRQLIADLNKVWFDLVAAINNDPLFAIASDTTIKIDEPASTIESIIQHTYHGAENLFYLSAQQGELIIHQPNDSPYKLSACKIILKYIYQQERMEPRCEEKNYTLTLRQELLSYLKKHNIDDNRLTWFEESGTSTPYPTWWMEQATLCSVWDRIVNLEIEVTTKKEHDYRLSLTNPHYQHVLNVLNKITDNPLNQFKTESLHTLSHFVVVNLNEFIALSKQHQTITMYQPQHIALLLELLKQLNTYCLTHDIDNPHLSRAMQLIAYLKKDGHFAWPDNYTQHNAAAYNIWTQEFKDCGFPTIEEFMASHNELITPFLNRKHYLKWIDHYTGDNDSPIQLKELEIRARAAMLCLNILADKVVCSDYMEIVRSYAYLSNDPKYINFIEQHNGEGKNDDSLIETWTNALKRSDGHPQRFYLNEQISELLTMTTFLYNTHAMKILIVEAIIYRLNYSLSKQREDNLAAYSNTQLGGYFHILKKFLTTPFSKENYLGVDIKELKSQAYQLCLKKLPGENNNFDLLTAESSELMRRHHKSYYQSYQTPYWDNRLSLQSYRKSSETAQVEIIYACIARFNLAKFTYESSQTSGIDLKFIRDILSDYLTKNLWISSPLLNEVKAILLQLDEHGYYKPNSPEIMLKKINEIKSYRQALLCVGGKIEATHLKCIFIDTYLARFNHYYHLLQSHTKPEDDLHNIQPIVDHLTSLYGSQLINQWMLEARLSLLDSLCSQHTNVSDFLEDDTVIDIYCELYELRHAAGDERLHGYLYQQACYLSAQSMKSFPSDSPHSKTGDTPTAAGLISACLLVEYWQSPHNVAQLQLLPPLLHRIPPPSYDAFKRTLSYIRTADVHGFQSYFIDLCICPIKLGFMKTLKYIQAMPAQHYNQFLFDTIKTLKVERKTKVTTHLSRVSSSSEGGHFLLWSAPNSEQEPSSKSRPSLHITVHG